MSMTEEEWRVDDPLVVVMLGCVAVLVVVVVVVVLERDMEKVCFLLGIARIRSRVDKFFQMADGTLDEDADDGVDDPELADSAKADGSMSVKDFKDCMVDNKTVSTDLAKRVLASLFLTPPAAPAPAAVPIPVLVGST